MRTKNLFSSLLLLFILPSLISAKDPIKFGKANIKALKMETYAGDTSAAAVILCDYGEFDPRNFQFRRIIRIKILKKEGLSWGDYVFSGYSKTAIKGVTYNLEDGKIVKDKLRNRSIYREHIIDDRYRLRAAFPNVHVGSVIDIQYSYTGFPDEWRFQKNVPVKYSELVLPKSKYVSFRKNTFGYEPVKQVNKNKWVAKNIPPFKKEPYTDSPENYITKFEFDLLSIHLPGNAYNSGFYKDYTTDWNAVARRLDESDYFGRTINNALYMMEVSREIEEQYTDVEDRLKAAYETIKKHVKWNEKERLYTSNASLRGVFKDGTGNSADVNIILVNLLNRLDIQAQPVVMSSRSNGLLSPIYPSLNKLNYVIAYAKIGEKDYLLDATEEFMPLGMLPPRALNEFGQRIYNKTATAVQIAPSKKSSVTALYMLELQEDLSIKGKASRKLSEYAAFNYRKKYQKFNSHTEFVEDKEKMAAGLIIQNVEHENLDDIYQPVKEQFAFEIANQVQQIDSQLYINPLLHLQMTETPFKTEERKYPIDYAYQREKIYTIQLTIPENYTVTETPSAIRAKLPENGGEFLYNIQVMGNSINIMYKFSLNKDMYLPTEYQYLRGFYNQIIKKHAEPIILTKI